MQTIASRPAIRASRLLLALALAGIATTAFGAPAESKDHAIWRELVHANPATSHGCFHTTYPSTSWVRDECRLIPRRSVTPPSVLIDPKLATKAKGATVGNGHDYAIGVNGLISRTVGSFPVVVGVKSEYSNGGISGPNEYTLQINSQFAEGTAACNGVPGCLAWQQFIYSPDYYEQGSAAVFMQYWLIYYQSTGLSCPDGWWEDGWGDCYTNSDYYMPAPNVPITQLGSESLSGSAAAGGNDTAVFTVGDTAYSIDAPDSKVGLASWWNASEFNIVGNAGGSKAVFNKGSFLLTRVAVNATNTAKPTCLRDAGTTGETNNLNLSKYCAAYSAPMPWIRFSQSN